MGKDEMDEVRVVRVARQDVIDSIITWISDVEIVLDHPDNERKMYLVAWFIEEIWCALQQTF